MAQNGEPTRTRRGMLHAIAGLAAGAVAGVSAAALGPADAFVTPAPDDAIVQRMTWRGEPITHDELQARFGPHIAAVEHGPEFVGQDGRRWRECRVMAVYPVSEYRWPTLRA